MKKYVLGLLLGLYAMVACQKQTQQQAEQQNIGSSKKPVQAAEPAEKVTENENDNLISCEGIGKVKLGMSYKALEKIFGAKNLQNDTTKAGTQMMGGEVVAEDQVYTTLTTPQGKVYIDWKDNKLQSVTKITVSYGNTKGFTLANGLRLGATLNELKTLNKSANFTFYGFGWQYGGIVLNEQAQGELFKQFPCMSLVLTPKNEMDYDAVQNLMGDERSQASVVSKAQGEEIIIWQITIEQK